MTEARKARLKAELQTRDDGSPKGPPKGGTTNAGLRTRIEPEKDIVATRALCYYSVCFSSPVLLDMVETRVVTGLTRFGELPRLRFNSPSGPSNRRVRLRRSEDQRPI
jgi:hypothetical protein